MSSIRTKLLRLINALLAPLKAEIRGVKTPPVAWLPYEAALLALLGSRRRLNILEIGANDGKWNDPLHEFILRNPMRTRLLLCEPQPEISHILAETYSGHPDATIFTGAVSSTDGSMTLYRVRPELWAKVRAPYLSGAPSYRAPSGFASADVAHVVDHVKLLRERATGVFIDPSSAIEELSVETVSMATLLSRFSRISPVDVLQIDVEGFDDVIVLSSISKEFLPKIVLFEVSHLTPLRYQEVVSHLTGFGYQTCRQSSDLLAIMTDMGGTSLTCRT